jgi:hypothetical protein
MIETDMIETDVIETDMIETDMIEIDMIAGMTGVMIDTTDAMTEVATVDGIADEVTIVIMTETLIGIAAHATTAGNVSSHLPVRQI